MRAEKIKLSIFHKKIRLAVFVGVGLLCGSCVGIKTPKRADLVPLKAPMVIGKYPVTVDRKFASGAGKDTIMPVVVWYFLKSSPGKDSLELAQATYIQLKLTDQKHLTAILYNRDIPLKTEIIKGHLSKGYFKSKHDLSVSGVPPFYWSMASSKMQIGVGREKQLFIDMADQTTGSILMVTAGTPGFTSSITVPAYEK